MNASRFAYDYLPLSFANGANAGGSISVGMTPGMIAKVRRLGYSSNIEEN